MDEFWLPLWLSTKLAMLTTLLLLVIAIPLSYLMTMKRFALKLVLKALITLPLVLPPSVLGYYLLVAFRPNSTIGTAYDWLFDERLAFSFEGILLGSIIFSFPFMVNPIMTSLESLPSQLSEASFDLGKSKWQTFIKVLLPNVQKSVLTACILTFAHTVGEFGVILLIGGNIPGETRVASIAIYHELEAMNYDQANAYALVLLIFSIMILLITQMFQNRRNPGILC